MLMEEVIIDWNTLQGTLQDSTLLDALRNDFTPGVCIYKFHAVFLISVCFRV